MKKKITPTLLTFLMGMGMIVSCAPVSAAENPAEILDDPVEYEDDENFVDYDHPLYASEGESDIQFPNKVILHYHNDDMACLNRRFYTWVTGVDGVERKADTASATDMAITLDFDVLTDYKNMPSLMFIIKVAGTWAGQSADMELSFEEFKPDANGVVEVWTIPGEGNSVEIYATEAETKFPKIKTAKFIDWKTIKCEADEIPLYYKLYAFDKNYLMGTPDEQISNKQFHLFKQGTPSSMIFNINFNYTAKINVQYVIESEYASNPGRVQKIVVSSENLFETERFEEFYTYNGNDLGMTYENNPGGGSSVTFKVWSPISAFVTVNIFSNGAPKSLGGSDAKRSYEMNYVKGGVWQITVYSKEIDLKGKYYTYSLTHSSGTVETIDPYAKASGINGVRGYVYDKTSADANPEGWDTVPSVWNGVTGYDIKSPQDLSIYEVHIRDLTMDDTWVSHKGNAHGTYGAFAEKGTTYSQDGKTVKTGFDHIEELGVKAIQLDDSYCIGMEVGMPTDNVLIVTDKGYGKKTYLSEYRLTKRGSKGVKALNTTDKNGVMVAHKIVTDDQDLIIITNSGMVIRMGIETINQLGRVTQGVKLINLKDGQEVSTITVVDKTPDEELTEGEEIVAEETPVEEVNEAQ